MKKIIALSIFLLAGILLMQTGCKPDPALSAGPVVNADTISFAVPKGWPQPVYTFQDNTLTQDGFALGRKLFYDPRLSLDNTVSCASCHQQFAAFSHLDHSVSHGIDGLLGTRNAPGLFNEAWQHAYFWDGGVINLENQPINPIQNHVEMGETMAGVITKISADATYQAQFKKIFGDGLINSQRMLRMLAQFMGAMVSANSRYDHYARGESGANFTNSELNGLTLFRQKCASCHVEPLFTDFSYRNNGLMMDPGYNDSGRARITGLPEDYCKFKIPSLRNVAITEPYMHDGRFTTLDAVLEHYRTGITSSATLDPQLATGISMTDAEKGDIIAFLQTLTDTTYTHDPRFSDPK